MFAKRRLWGCGTQRATAYGGTSQTLTGSAEARVHTRLHWEPGGSHTARTHTCVILEPVLRSIKVSQAASCPWSEREWSFLPGDCHGAHGRFSLCKRSPPSSLQTLFLT